MLASRSRRRGNTLVTVVVLLVLLVGMVAFAIDVGRVAHARTGLQSAADAGALAGIAKLQSGLRSAQDTESARSEVNEFVGGAAGNMPGLAVSDSDIQFGVYDPKGAPGSRFTAAPAGRPSNAARVTLRRDGDVNPRLALSFSSVLGKTDSAVTARATAWSPPAGGVLPDAPLIPYAAQVDYFLAAAGLPPRPSNSPGFKVVNANTLPDDWSIGLAGSTPTKAPDGVKEIVLFSSTQHTPGNFGSVDLGDRGNGTNVLVRQLVSGPNASDFALMRSAGQLAPDGSLRAPVTLGGDTGVSNGTQSTWQSIVGQNRIVPLFSTVSGNGNNAAYRIVGFAGVRVVDVKLSGNPKRVWVQPTWFYSNKVVASSSDAQVSIGVYAPARLVLP